MIYGQIAILIIVALAIALIAVLITNAIKKYYIGTIVQSECTFGAGHSYYFDVQYVIDNVYKTKRIEVTYKTYCFFKVGDKITIYI